jgi:hypothetical protein
MNIVFFLNLKMNILSWRTKKIRKKHTVSQNSRHPRNHESALTTWVKALPGEETHLLAVALGEVDDEAARRRQRHQRPRAGVPQLRVDRRRLLLPCTDTRAKQTNPLISY